MRLQRVLVGTDFSTASAVAVRQAVGVASGAGAEVVVAHASVIPSEAPPLYRETPMLRELWEKLLRSECDANRAKLAAATERLRRQGANATELFLAAFPDEGLLDAVEETCPDLLFLGAHTNRDPRRARLGRVSGAVARCATVPVMIARPLRDPERGYRRILVPMDFSPAAERALTVATSLATADSQVDMVFFWAPGAPLLPHWPDIDDDSRRDAERLQGALVEAAERYGSGLVERHVAEPPAVSFVCSRDTPVRGLRRWMQTQPVDLVVMGSHGYRGRRRLQLGSVARAVARDASCSVLVVQPSSDSQD